MTYFINLSRNNVLQRRIICEEFIIFSVTRIGNLYVTSQNLPKFCGNQQVNYLPSLFTSMLLSLHLQMLTVVDVIRHICEN
jgi:hypothetical protein